MSNEGRKDELKGRTKKAAGEMTGDKELKREGQMDKAEGKTKKAVDKTRDAMEGRERHHE